MAEKHDFTTPAALAKRDEETLKRKDIKAPDLGAYRIEIGNATFFFKTKERMDNSIVHSGKFKDRGMIKCLTNEEN